jgi:cystathionine gamma-synthase
MKKKKNSEIKKETIKDPILHFTTLSIHADKNIENTPDLAPPIHLSTTYSSNSDGLVYSRVDQMTRRRLEAVLGALEGGKSVVYSSGLAAVLAALYLFKPKKVSIEGGYWMTKNLMNLYGEGSGLQLIPLNDKMYEILEKGDVIWIESPKNPTCEMDDIRKISEKAHKMGVYVIVDSTFATPVLQKTLELGADISLHSCTKALGGHSDLLGGALLTKDETMHYKLKKQRSLLGNVMGNLETYLLLRSLRTLYVRVKRQSKTGKKIAKFLASHPKVAKVWHPSISSHPAYKLAKKQMSGPPYCFSFETTSAQEAVNLPKKLNIFTEATSLGGVESLIDYRYKYDPDVSDCLLRISIGLESSKDLINDLKSALEM